MPIEFAGGDRDHRCLDRRVPAPGGAAYCVREAALSKRAVSSTTSEYSGRSQHTTTSITNDCLPMGMDRQQVALMPGPIINSWAPSWRSLTTSSSSALFNAMNFSVNMFDILNTTIVGTGLSMLWCPSDSGGYTCLDCLHTKATCPPVTCITAATRGTPVPGSTTGRRFSSSPPTGFQQMNEVLSSVQQHQACLHHRRDEQHVHLRRAHAGDRKRCDAAFFHQAILRLLRRHDSHDVLARSPIPPRSFLATCLGVVFDPAV